MCNHKPYPNAKRPSQPDVAVEVAVEDLGPDLPISTAELQAIEQMLGDDWQKLLAL